MPWLPAADPTATRMVNEIVLAEESDEDGRGGYLSHFGLYLRAMTRCGADTTAIDRFLAELRRGRPVPDALGSAGVVGCVRRFVGRTFEVVEGGSLCEIASAFTFGREDILPELFRRIVDGLNVEAGAGLDDFLYYLRRHIGLDGDEHGPMAGRLIESLCGTDDRWREVEGAAVAALEARLDLWDGVSAALRRRREPAAPGGTTGPSAARIQSP